MGLAPVDVTVRNKVVCAASVVRVRQAGVCLNVQQITVQDINVGVCPLELRDVVEFNYPAAHQTNRTAYRCGLDGPGWLSGKSKEHLYISVSSGRSPLLNIHTSCTEVDFHSVTLQQSNIHDSTVNEKERLYNCFSIHLLGLGCFQFSCISSLLTDPRGFINSALFLFNFIIL